MKPNNEKHIWEAESQADSQLSMIEIHGTPCKDNDEFETAESIREFFKPDFSVYLQKHSGTTDYNDITKQTLKKYSFETQELV